MTTWVWAERERLGQTEFVMWVVTDECERRPVCDEAIVVTKQGSEMVVFPTVFQPNPLYLRAFP